VLAVVMVAVLAAFGTVLAAGALHRGESQGAEREADQQAATVAQAVADGVDRYSDYLTGLGAAVGAQQRLEAEEFEAITAPVRRTVLPGVTGVAYVVPVGNADIGRVQTYWRDRGATGLTLRGAPEVTGEHLFVVLSRSADRTPSSIGQDLAAAIEPANAMREAATNRNVMLSGAYVLRRDTNLPPAQRQEGFVLAVAVRGTAPAADAGRLRGWLLLGLRSGDFLRDAIGAVAGRAAAVDLTDSADDLVPIAQWKPGVPLDPDLAARVRTVDVPGRSWRLTVRATTALLDHEGTRPSRIALGVGAAITALLIALTTSIATSRDRARRRVRVATGALRDDIRRREKVERQLRRREAELVGFAGVIAHDLRGPLASITGYTDFLREEAGGVLEDDHREFLERMAASEHQMAVLIDDLLGYATADNRPLRTEPVDLNRLVEQIVQTRIGVPDARTAVVTVGPLPNIDGDPTLLRQVFDNLIGNAVKYTPADRVPQVRIHSERHGDGHWRIEVTDNGIGIPEDQREAVFAAFTRADGSANFPGTGLGLAIVHRIVERHGGAIGVSPGRDEGSCFWLVIPERPAPATEPAKASPAR
jgi:signal transduction histidine kinase